MKAASVSEIKKELKNLDEERLQELCMRLVKYKKENKELLTYLLFEADNEPGYVNAVKEEMDNEFEALPKERNTYFTKKSLRKILRIINRQLRYSGIPETELELRLFFCRKVKEAKVSMPGGTVIFNMYQQQMKKIDAILEKLPEDLQGDYEKDLQFVRRG